MNVIPIEGDIPLSNIVRGRPYMLFSPVHNSSHLLTKILNCEAVVALLHPAVVSRGEGIAGHCKETLFFNSMRLNKGMSSSAKFTLKQQF